MFHYTVNHLTKLALTLKKLLLTANCPSVLAACCCQVATVKGSLQKIKKILKWCFSLENNLKIGFKVNTTVLLPYWFLTLLLCSSQMVRDSGKLQLIKEFLNYLVHSHTTFLTPTPYTCEP